MAVRPASAAVQWISLTYKLWSGDMAPIKISKFGGMLPAWDSRLLPDGQADYSLNSYLFSGALIGWRQPKLLYTLKNSTTQFAFRIPNRSTNNTAITAADS